LQTRLVKSLFRCFVEIHVAQLLVKPIQDELHSTKVIVLDNVRETLANVAASAFDSLAGFPNILFDCRMLVVGVSKISFHELLHGERIVRVLVKQNQEVHRLPLGSQLAHHVYKR